MTDFTAAVAAATADGYPQPPAANTDQVTAIASAFARLFELQLPDDYRSFLLTCNGFEHDGRLFYGIVDAWGDNEFHPGLFDSNERLVHGLDSVETPLRFVGESGHELFAHDTEDTCWKVVDRITWTSDDPSRTYATFGELFASVHPTLT